MRTSRLWADLERDAHRVVLELIDEKHALDDFESIASRILLARSDLSASMREAYRDPLAAVVRKYAELLAAQQRS
jgi:hypothetical protein